MLDQIINFATPSTGTSWSLSATFVLLSTLVTLIALGALTALVVKRKEIQPLKIKSPLLLAIFLVGNMVTVLLIMFVMINVEVCYSQGSCNSGLRSLAETCGYLLVCFAEPLLLLSFMFRFVRIRKIFDAQQIYFEHGVRPSEMIQRYSEKRLSIVLILIVAVSTTAYLVAGSVSLS